MTTETCPTCGSPVRVVSSGEGTNHYESSEAASPATALLRLRGALEWLRDHGYQPGYNGRPSCPFCENFVDDEEGHDADCALVYALAALPEHDAGVTVAHRPEAQAGEEGT